MRFFYLLSIFLIFFFNSIGQPSKSDPTDFQSWSIISLGLNLPKKWDLSVDGQLRTENNSKTFKGVYLSPEAGYSFSKKVRVFIDYRYARMSDAYSSRVGLGIELVSKKSGWNFGFRPQVQHTLSYADDGEGSADAKTIFRARFQARHAITKKLDGYFSVEPFLNFDPNEYIIDNIRNTIGLRYEYRKGRKLGFFYIFRPDYAKSYNRTFHVAGIRWDFDWKVKD